MKTHTPLITLFRRDVRTRHENSPFLEERNRYLKHLAQNGSSPRRIRTIASILVTLLRFLDLETSPDVTLCAVENAQRLWMESFNSRHRRPVNEESRDEFRRIALHWLKFCDLLAPEPIPVYPYGDILPRFVEHLRDVMGMADETVKKSRLQALWFLRWANDRRESLSEISSSDVQAYLAHRESIGHKPRSIATSSQVLRSFFRYAEEKHLTHDNIASRIQGPSVPRYDPDPQGPRWADIRRLIDSRVGCKASDLRGRAILMLFAIYGLRSSEVSRLSLDDFNWFNGTFVVRRAKHGGAQRFPLQYEVGEAILEYLKRARPVGCRSRNLLVTLHPPYRPVPVGSLLGVVNLRLKGLSIRSPQGGPRGLRHACATELLRKGHSLSEIADFLGHRSTGSVSVYAKPSASSLRRVSTFDLGGLA